MLTDTLQIGKFTLKVQSASFRYITDSWSGAGWDFNFHGVATDEAGKEIFPFDATLRTEAAPMPLENNADLAGTEIFLPLPYDEDSEEPLFGLMIGEEHEVSHVRLKFEQQDGNRYLISLEGMVASTVFGQEAPLKLLAWAEKTADHAYPA